MRIRPIKTAADHAAALSEVERLWDAAAGTPQGDRFEVLSTLIDAYEREHFPIATPSPIAAIRFRMEQQGLQPGDLVAAIGHRGRVSEVLSGKRPLTLAMIQKLHATLGIPAEALIGTAKRPARGKTRIVSHRKTPRSRRAARGARPARRR
jgi:HTH-type transcriptional regulator/antitoxin HigA